MYRARKRVPKSAEDCPYRSRVPETKRFRYHQDTNKNERSDTEASPLFSDVSGKNLTHSVRRNFRFLISIEKRWREM